MLSFTVLGPRRAPEFADATSVPPRPPQAPHFDGHVPVTVGLDEVIDMTFVVRENRNLEWRKQVVYPPPGRKRPSRQPVFFFWQLLTIHFNPWSPPRSLEQARPDIRQEHPF